MDADDIADVSVAALIGEEHSGQTYEVTAPVCPPSPRPSPR
ncbi:hypothetical protein ACQEU3_38260 [Spirillospora sp. CA-253888]